LPLIFQAWKGIKTNQHIVFSFILVSAAITLAFSSLNIVLNSFLEEDAEIIPVWMSVAHIFFDLLSSAVYAVFYTIFFGLLGKELDKPIWKYGSAIDTLKRFFLPWFIMVLGIVTLVRMQEGIIRLGYEADMFLSIEVIILFMYLFSVPIGASIMFIGRFQWSLLGEAITPLWQLFSLTWLVLLINFGQYMLLQTMLYSLQSMSIHTPIAMAIIDMPHTLLNILAFVMCWEILKIYRNLNLGKGE